MKRNQWKKWNGNELIDDSSVECVFLFLVIKSGNHANSIEIMIAISCSIKYDVNVNKYEAKNGKWKIVEEKSWNNFACEIIALIRIEAVAWMKFYI